MSNQVYSNEKQKYYDMKGFNKYVNRNPTLIVLPTPAQTPLDYLESITARNNVLVLDNSFRDIKAVKEGLYSYSLNLRFESTVTPATVDVEPAIQLFIVKPDTTLININSSLFRIPARGADVGAAERNLNISGTVYLNIDDSLRCIMSSQTDTSLTMLAYDILITKIY